MMKTLGERLKYARNNCPEWINGRTKKVTQSELATLLSVTRAAITQVERNITSSMKYEKLTRIAHYLQVDAGWLVTGNPEKAPKGRALAEEKASAKQMSELLENSVISSINSCRPDSLYDELEQISILHALSGQILDNAQNKLPWERLAKQLRQTCRDVIDK